MARLKIINPNNPQIIGRVKRELQDMRVESSIILFA